VPWPGGAKKVDLGIPLAFLGIRGWYWLCLSFPGIHLGTLIQMVVLGTLVSLHCVSLIVEWRTKFFLTWLCLSIVALYHQFYTELMPVCSVIYTGVLHALFLLMLATLFLAVYSQPDPAIHDAGSGDEDHIPLRGSHCRMCNVWVFGRDHHCVWLDDCVGGHNHGYFLSFLCSFVLLAMQFTWLVLRSGHAAGLTPPLLQGSAIYAGFASVAVALLACSQVQQISINKLTSESIAISKRERQLKKRYDEHTKSPQLRQQLDSERGGSDEHVHEIAVTMGDGVEGGLLTPSAVHPESQQLRGRGEEEETAIREVDEGTDAKLQLLVTNWRGFLDGSRLRESSLKPLHPRAIRF
jgi:hypothetical protein